MGVGVAGGGGIGVKAGIELQSPDISANCGPSGTVHIRPLCGPMTYQKKPSELEPMMGADCPGMNVSISGYRLPGPMRQNRFTVAVYVHASCTAVDVGVDTSVGVDRGVSSVSTSSTSPTVTSTSAAGPRLPALSSARTESK